MPPYCDRVSACDASAKNAKVTSPVAPKPMLTTAALRPYPAGPPSPLAGSGRALGGADGDKDHGPREGLPALLHLPVVLQQGAEPHVRPVVHVPWRVAEVAEVRAPRHVEHAPER